MKVLSNVPVTQAIKSQLAEKFPEHEFIYEQKLSEKSLENCEAFFGQMTEAELKICKNLRFFQSSSSGVEKYCADGVLDEQTVFCSATGAFGPEIAEVMLAMALSLRKNLQIYRDQQNAKKWEFYKFNKPILGSNVLILGLGDLGMNFAKLMAAHDCHVVGVKKHMTKKPDCVHELHTIDEIDSLISQADIIAMCLPDTAETDLIMNRERIFAMKKASILINVGRSNSLDNHALLEAVSTGHLDGAAIDVAPEEPLPSDHELWTNANIIITPHVAGLSYSPYIIDDVVGIFMANFSAFLEGKELLTQVDLSSGYMKSRE